MKKRNGFVSNSSSSSFTTTEFCYVCGDIINRNNRGNNENCCKKCENKKDRKKKLEIIDLIEKANEN